MTVKTDCWQLLPTSREEDLSEENLRIAERLFAVLATRYLLCKSLIPVKTLATGRGA